MMLFALGAATAMAALFAVLWVAKCVADLADRHGF